MDSEMLEQNLKCPICLTIADEPYETSCCGHIFCARCIKGVKKTSCPICRCTKVVFRENTFVKMLLNNSKVTCPFGCGVVLALANVKVHRYLCEAATFKCSIVTNGVKCTFEGCKKESLNHFGFAHSDQMIILAEHYSSLKNTFDKNSYVEKVIKQVKAEREKDVCFKDDEELNEFKTQNNQVDVNNVGEDSNRESESLNKLVLPSFNFQKFFSKK